MPLILLTTIMPTAYTTVLPTVSQTTTFNQIGKSSMEGFLPTSVRPGADVRYREGT